MDNNSYNERINTTDSNEVSLKELVIKIKNFKKYLWSKKMSIILAIVIGAICGYFYTFLKPTLYKSTTTFVLEDGNSPGGGSLSNLASIAGFDISGGAGGGIFQGENLLELYKSRKMLQEALLSYTEISNHPQQLVERYIQYKNLRKTWAKKSYRNISFNNNKPFTRLQDSLLESFVQDIKANVLTVGKSDKKINIMSIEVKSPDEYFSKNFNDQIVKTVNDFYVQTKTQKSVENLKILEHHIDSVKKGFNSAIYRSVEVGDATPNLNVTRQIIKLPSQQRSQFSAETNRALLTQMIQNLEMSKINLSKETPLIQIIDSPIYPLTVEKLSRSKSILIGSIISSTLLILMLVIKRSLDKLLT